LPREAALIVSLYIPAMAEPLPPTPGRFIVFEGGEGSGKTTQAQLLAAQLQRQGRTVVQVRDPGTTRIGEMVRQLLLNPDHSEMAMRCEMLLYMAARAQLMRELILPALARGEVVLSDRFVSSTLAYQLGGDGLSADHIRSVADVAISGRWPDLVLILDMPTGQSIARVKRAKDRIEQRPMEYHAQVRQNYLAQAAADPARFRVIDADRDAALVQADVVTAVKSAL
jgi:dTMP kinase